MARIVEETCGTCGAKLIETKERRFCHWCEYWIEDPFRLLQCLRLAELPVDIPAPKFSSEDLDDPSSMWWGV